MNVIKEKAEKGRIVRTLVDDNGYEVKLFNWVMFYRGDGAHIGRFLGWKGAKICIGPAMKIGEPMCIQVRTVKAIEAIEPVWKLKDGLRWERE